MDNWQYEYAIGLLQKGRQAIEREKQLIEADIKSTDKRTYNGKMHCIFERAKLYVVNALLQF